MASSAKAADFGLATEAVAASAAEAEFSPATETQAASAAEAEFSPASEAEAASAKEADPGPATEAEAGLGAEAELCPATAAQAQQHQPAYQGFMQDLALIEPASAQAQPSSPPTDLQTGQQSPSATAAAVSDSAIQQSESTANVHQMVTDGSESSVRDITQAGCGVSQERLAAAVAAPGSDEASVRGQPCFVGTQSGTTNGQTDLRPGQAEACRRQQSLHDGQPDFSTGQTSSADWQPSFSSDQPGHDAELLQAGCGQQTLNNMQSSASASWSDASSHMGSDVEVQPGVVSQPTAAEVQTPELVEGPQNELVLSQQEASAACADNSSLESYASLQQASVSPVQLTQKPAASDADTAPQQPDATTAVSATASELSPPACASEQHSADDFKSEGLLSGCASESGVNHPGLEQSDSFQRQTSQGFPGSVSSLLCLCPGLEQPEADSGAMLRHQGLSRSGSWLSQLLPGLEQPNTAQQRPSEGLSRSVSALLPLYPGLEQPDTSARQNNQPPQRLLSCASQLSPGLEQPSNIQRQVAEALTRSVSALLQLWPGLEQADVRHTSMHASELTQALSTLQQNHPDLQKPPVTQITEHQEELSRSPLKLLPLVPNTAGSVTAGDQQDGLPSRSSSAGLQVFPGLEKPESGQSQQDDSLSASLSAWPQLYPGLEQPDPQQVLQPTAAESASMSGLSGQLYPGLEQAMLHMLRQALQSASSQPSACLSSQPSWVYPGREPLGSNWAQHAQQEGPQSSLSQPAAASTTRGSVTEEHSDHQQVEAGVLQVQTEILGVVELLALSMSIAPVDLFQGFAGTALQLRLSQGSLHMLFAAASISVYTTLVKSSSSLCQVLL